jgi:hypothetical protein
MISRRRASMAFAGMAAPAILAGCTSSSEPQPVTARLNQVRQAHTPQAAAVGFDRALQLQRSSPFDCLPGADDQFSYYGGLHHTETAATTRRGDRWIVTITYDHDRSLTMRYRVRQQGAGYCVDRVLG